MKKTAIWVLVALVLVAGVLRLAGDAAFWQRYAAALAHGTPVLPAKHIEPRVRIAGDGPRASPQALPEDQGIAPEAVEAALAQARTRGDHALVIHRRGHRIAAYFGEGTEEGSLVAGGGLAALLPALAAGVLVEEGRLEANDALAAIEELARKGMSGNWRNPWSHSAREHFGIQGGPLFADALKPSPVEFLSQRVWQPLGAGDAWAWGAEVKTARIDCCSVARLGDWMRLGDLLLGQGEREGERIVRAQWVRQLLQLGEPGAAPRLRWLAAPAPFGGDEPPAARDAVAIDLAPGLRLWMVPSRQLAVLHWAADQDSARDTLVTNLLLRGIVDAHPAAVHGEGGQTPLGDIVPRH